MSEEKNINLTSGGNAENTASLNINTPKATEANAEKTFTQEQVEALIADRIKRERKVNEALVPVKQLLRQLQENGAVSGKSYSEIADDLILKLSAKQQADADEAVGKTTESNAVLTAENEDKGIEKRSQKDGSDKAQDKNADNEGIEENKRIPDMDTLCAFKEKYPSLDMNMLFDGGMFKSFAKGREGNLMEICEDYCAFLSKLGALPKAEAKKAVYGGETDNERDNGYPMNSTAFSSMSGTSALYADGLTKQQMEIAKSGGLSYREYAELLSSIPQKNGLR